MSLKITFSEAKARFKERRDDIELCEKEYISWTKKAKFYDLVEKKYFWAKPSAVFVQNSAHPNRAKQLRINKKTLSFTDAQERIAEAHKEVVLIEEGYQGWKKKAKFYDLIEKDYFWSLPSTVFKNKNVHPNRRNHKKQQTFLKKYGVDNPAKNLDIKEKTRQTNLKLYGNACSLHGNSIKEKTRQTNLKKHGAENPMHSDEVKKKVKNTNLEKYGNACSLHGELVKGKVKKSMLEKYGVDHFSKTNKFKQVYKKTSVERFGTDNFFKTDEFKKACKETSLEKYGVDHFSKTDEFKNQMRKIIKGDENHFFHSKRFIVETGEHLREWLEKQPEPKPGYTSLNQFFPNEKIHLVDLENYLKNYKDSKTNLEVFCEKLFELKHFDKKPKEIKKLYKPDFKLSDGIFLNVDGLYWHSELERDKKYHFNLRKEFEDSGLRIFQFREDEIYQKSHIVKSIVSNSLGRCPNKIWARKCELKPAAHSEAKEFLTQNHMMESIGAKHIGLYHKDRLISLMSFKQRGKVCKIERFCSAVDHSVVGGFSKLLKHVEGHCLKPEVTEIHNWVDLRYGTGEHLLDKGFVLEKETLGWRWTDFKTTYNRLQCKANMDDRGLTEKEHAEELGWVKIYDAGQRLYVKNIL